MTDDLIERLRGVDPATDERVDREARALGNLTAGIVAAEHDVPAAVAPPRRGPSPRRLLTLAAAAIIALAVAVPLALLSPLGGGGSGPGSSPTTSPTVFPRPAAIEVISPAQGDTVQSPFTVTGTADVFEATLSYELLDGEGGVLDEGFTTATCGSGCRGDFSFRVRYTLAEEQAGTLRLFELSAEDGSEINAVEISLTLTASSGELPAIVVETPAPGDVVTSPVTIAGTADVFEATVSIRIYDSVNNLIVDTFTTATCGTGCRGDFSIEIPFAVAERQGGRIVVFESSAKDGSMINVVEIPVTLVPGPQASQARSFLGPWVDGAGNPVPDDVVVARLGAEHCSWGDIVFLTEQIGAEQHTFVRDTTGEIAAFTRGTWDRVTEMPADAAYTGYHVDDWQLWTSPSEDRYVYIHNGIEAGRGVTERWPLLLEDPLSCD
jgi:hypothetical protein